MRSVPGHAIRLGFGCASLGSRVGERAGLRALDFAFDQGVEWFDLAPSYGDGQAESIFATFARARRGAIRICTKVGIGPPEVSGMAKRLRPAMRAALELSPALSRVIAKGRPKSSSFELSAELVRSSINGSLKRLGCDEVEVYALHDPSADDLERDEILQALDEVVRSGKARMIGVAGSAEVAAAALRSGLPFGHLQFADGPDLSTWPPLVKSPTRPLVVTHSIRRSAAGGGGTGIGPIEGQDEYGRALRTALERNRGGLVLASMFSPRHCAANVAVARNLGELEWR